MKLATLALALAAVLTGCAQPQFTEGAKLGQRVDDKAAPDARIQYDQVVILDRSLQGVKAGKIAVESQGSRRTPTGTLKVIAQLRNRTDFTQIVEARVSFFDAGNVPIEKASAWNRIVLDANGIGVYEGSSIQTAQVAHYLVEIREAR
jgi:hypothetical protein